MGLSQLIANLQENKQHRVDEIWRQAREQAVKIQREADESIMEYNRVYEQRREQLLKTEHDLIVGPIQKQVEIMHLLAINNLAATLERLAGELLPNLRTTAYAETFANLRNEIPLLHWQQVVVNPDDAGLAAAVFPGIEILTDQAIAGGFIIKTADDAVVIDNTLEKRLENAWPFLLPRIAREIIPEVL